MDISIFTDKLIIPNNNDLSEDLGQKIELWQNIRNIVFEKHPSATEEWNYPGKKYGWSFRIKDKKRAIIYFLPREKYFKVAFAFGQKATNEILASSISPYIKNELESARVYAEGRGIRIDVTDKEIMDDIKMLIDIKLKY